jgi:hypothetical protein
MTEEQKGAYIEVKLATGDSVWVDGKKIGSEYEEESNTYRVWANNGDIRRTLRIPYANVLYIMEVIAS